MVSFTLRPDRPDPAFSCAVEMVPWIDPVCVFSAPARVPCPSAGKTAIPTINSEAKHLAKLFVSRCNGVSVETRLVGNLSIVFKNNFMVGTMVTLLNSELFL